jgi:hypothetical protein
MFTLIVCTIDRTEPLDRLLHSLARQSDRDFEIVLVDQNVDDRLAWLGATFGRSIPISYVKAARVYRPLGTRALVWRVGRLSGFPTTTAIIPLRCLSVYASDSPPPTTALRGDLPDAANPSSFACFGVSEAESYPL